MVDSCRLLGSTGRLLVALALLVDLLLHSIALGGGLLRRRSLLLGCLLGSRLWLRSGLLGLLRLVALVGILFVLLGTLALGDRASAGARALGRLLGFLLGLGSRLVLLLDLFLVSGLGGTGKLARGFLAGVGLGLVIRIGLLGTIGVRVRVL